VVGDESEKARLDRELIEFLNEIRVALPGVQVLFAFLLVLPFSNGFSKVSSGERGVYYGAVLCTLLASVLFIAPTTYHRIRFRSHDKERLIRTSNRLALAGSVLLAAAMCCAAYLVSEVVFDVAAGVATASVAAVAFAWFWYGLPFWHARRDRSE
jgi:ABC-type Fe3+-siderophore transport system permease subunit